MTEATPNVETPAAPTKPPKARKPAKAKASPAAPKVDPPEPEALSEFAGMTRTKCPDACMKDGTCVISTVNVCKHPCMNGDSGCGPITMANRAKAKRYLKIEDANAS